MNTGMRPTGSYFLKKTLQVFHPSTLHGSSRPSHHLKPLDADLYLLFSRWMSVVMKVSIHVLLVHSSVE